jgi:AraC family transcriptional regulator
MTTLPHSLSDTTDSGSGSTLVHSTHRNPVDRSQFAPFGLVTKVTQDIAASAQIGASVQIHPSGSVKRHSAGWRGLWADSIYAPIGAKLEFRFDALAHLLVVYHEGARRDGETSVGGIDSSKLRNLAAKLTFVPARYEYQESHEISAPTRITFIYLDPTKMQTVDDASYAPKLFFEDPIVWNTATKLKSAIESARTDRAFYSEALARVLAHELVRPHREANTQSSASRGGLASWQVRAVTAYIEEHLGERISLATLARLTRLSHHHFCRAFKQSFGIAPHQYHVQQRIERAKVLLAEATNSVTDIALILGYSQTGAFSIAFRKATGRTARAFRRDFT